MFEISFALSLTETGYPRRNATSRRSAFARLTRYSASDIAPAIATAVAPSREKIFWTTLDPTKNPFEARLSAARTTPSLLRMPTVVVMLNLGLLCGRSGKLIQVPETKSHEGRTFRRTALGILGAIRVNAVSTEAKRPATWRRRSPQGRPRALQMCWRPFPPVQRPSDRKVTQSGPHVRRSVDPSLRCPIGRSR